MRIWCKWYRENGVHLKLMHGTVLGRMKIVWRSRWRSRLSAVFLLAPPPEVAMRVFSSTAFLGSVGRVSQFRLLSPVGPSSKGLWFCSLRKTNSGQFLRYCSTFVLCCSPCLFVVANLYLCYFVSFISWFVSFAQISVVLSTQWTLWRRDFVRGSFVCLCLDVCIHIISSHIIS